ncbi:MAG: hypothetical protein IEMM0002_1330 [bacterium]|nr:MAG: hypothetical protein IEMM0002_1330 [bacterium]
MNTKFIVLVLAVFLMLCSVGALDAKENSYPANQVKRPLLIPMGMWEISPGFVYIQKGQNSDNHILPTLDLRYGINDNMEFLYPLGIRVRLPNGFGSLETAARGVVGGVGYSSSAGMMFMAEAGIEGKHRVNDKFAVELDGELRHWYTDRVNGNSGLKLSVGGLYGLNDLQAVSVTGSFVKLWGFDDDDGLVGAVAFYYGLDARTEIVGEIAFSNFSQNRSELYPYADFMDTYKITVNWRF